MAHEKKSALPWKKQQDMSQLVLSMNSVSKNDQYYAMRLCRWMAENNLPFFKLRSKSFTGFLEEFTHHKTPSETVIRSSYLEKEFNKEMDEMRSSLNSAFVYLIFDETTDADGRAIGLVLGGALSKTEGCRPYVLSCEEMKDVNNKTVSQVGTK